MQFGDFLLLEDGQRGNFKFGKESGVDGAQHVAAGVFINGFPDLRRVDQPDQISGQEPASINTDDDEV